MTPGDSHAAGSQSSRDGHTARDTFRDYVRGAAGGLIVGLPLLMTMEMWWNGFYMPPLRLLLFFLFTFGVLVILERYSGFRESFSLFEEVQDAVVALGIALLTSALVLFLLNVIGPGYSWHEILGKIILESLAVSIGVSVAISQLGGGSREVQQRAEPGLWDTKLMGLAGAMYFGLNIAVTEEPVMIAMQMDWWHSLLLAGLSFGLIYAIIYAMGFRGEHKRAEDRSLWRVLLQDGAITYALALAVAAYLLWTFGRFDPDTGLVAILQMTITLGFVTSLGTAAANLLL